MKIIEKITGNKVFFAALAALLSIILWLYVMNYENTDMEVSFKNLEIDYLGGDTILQDRQLLVTDRDQQSVDLVIIGKRNQMMKLNKNDIRVTVDLTDIRSTGVYEKVYTIEYPEGFNEGETLIVKRNPEYVTVNIDKLSSRSVPVQGGFNGSVADGYMFEQIVYEPDSIVVSGPEEVVSHIKSAFVEVDRENLTKSVSGQVSYVLMDYEGKAVESQEISTDTKAVAYSIQISMLKNVVLKADVVAGGGANESNAVVTITPKVITLKGNADVLEGVNQINLGSIDLSEFEQSYSRSFAIPLPNNTSCLSGEKEAMVDVSIKGLATKKVLCTEISFINVSEGYVATPITQYMEVTIRGPKEIIDLIEYNNIQIVGDLSDIGNAVGRYSVATKITITGYSEAGVIGDNYNVVVSLEEEPEAEEESKAGEEPNDEGSSGDRR